MKRTKALLEKLLEAKESECSRLHDQINQQQIEINRLTILNDSIPELNKHIDNQSNLIKRIESGKETYELNNRALEQRAIQAECRLNAIEYALVQAVNEIRKYQTEHMYPPKNSWAFEFKDGYWQKKKDSISLAVSEGYRNDKGADQS